MNATPPLIAVLTTWSFDPVAALVIVVLGVAYGWGVRAVTRSGGHWPGRRSAAFYLLGLGSFALVSFGILGTYTVELRWAFITRIALLLFGVPALMSLGRPIGLGRLALTGGAATAARAVLRSLPVRILSSALFAPLFAMGVFSVFLTPFSGTLRQSLLAQDLITVLLPLLGLVMVLPIIEQTGLRTSFSMTIQFMLLFVELLADSIPAILLRLADTVTDGIPTITGAIPGWFPSALHDQHLAADLLWFIVEAADVPLLILLFIRWSKIDRAEAKQIDELSDEELEAMTQEHLRRRSQ